MATAPYFHWPSHSSSSAAGAPDSDLLAGFGSVAPEMAPAADTAGALDVSPEERAVPVRTRARRNSAGSGKHQAGGGGAKKPPQRGLGVAELERLRCGGDPLRDLLAAGGDAAQVHPLVHCNHHHSAPAVSAFDARYSPSLLAAVHQQSPAAAPPPAAGPGCYVRHPAPEQQYFTDRWGRMGPGTGSGEHHHHQAQLLLPPEHPSSQNSIWRPAASSSSSCLHSGHRCDLCARRVMSRAFGERGAAPPPPAAPPSPTAYSIYDLAAAMATAHQCCVVRATQGEAAESVVRDRKRGALPGEEPARKEVREIEFFPAATTHHAGGTGPDESEFVASSSYGAAGSFAAPPQPLDLSLKL